MRTTSRQWTVDLVLAHLKRNASLRNIEGMARYGIVAPKAFGVGTTPLKILATKIGRNHDLALKLWKTGWYEARVLAAFIADPRRLTPQTMDRWVHDFDNWAITDGLCIHLFRKTADPHRLVGRWTRGRGEFVRRAGFTMIATLAVHDKSAQDRVFVPYLGKIRRHSGDGRNGVKKAVNWALRQIGKRNRSLYHRALKTAEVLASSPDPSTRWIGKDALREFNRPSIIARIKPA